MIEGGAVGLAVFLAALGVKALDDLVDEPERMAWETGAPRIVAYAVLFLVVAAGVAPAVVVSLFLCAYALGMAPTPWERLPSGLPSWLESVGAVGLAALLTGPVETAGSLLLLAGVQVFDDYLDLDLDRAEGRPNIAAALGRQFSAVLAAALFLGAVVVAPAKALAGLVVTAAVAAGPEPALDPLLGRHGVAKENGAGQTVMETGMGAKGEKVMGLILRYRLALAGLAAVVLAGLSALLALRIVEAPPEGAGTLGGALAAVTGLAPAGLGQWALAFGAFLLTAAVGTGFALAYRRGLETGRRRGLERHEALKVLLKRAERMEGE
jgi:hypothetical protein